jgi:hypothetical protein
MSLESKTPTKRDGLGIGRCSPGSATSGWSCHIGSLVIVKELHTMEEMIGEELGARLAKATPARLRNDDWQSKGSMDSVQVWPHERLTCRRHIFGRT